MNYYNKILCSSSDSEFNLFGIAKRKATQFWPIANQILNLSAKYIIFNDKKKPKECGAFLQIATQHFQNKLNPVTMYQLMKCTQIFTD